MDASRVKRDFEQILDKVSREQTRVLVEEQGRPVAGIVSPYDVARLNQLDADWDADWRVFDEIHARNRDKSLEEVEQDVAAALKAVRRAAHGKARRPPNR